MIYEKISNELQRLDEEITNLQLQLNNAPPGKLIIARNQSRFKWYVSDGQNRTYLPKSQRPQAELLARKKYLTLRLQDLLHEKQALQFYLRHHSTNSDSATCLLLNSPFQNLLAPYFKPFTHDVQEWIESDFVCNTKYPEQLIHKSLSGNIVRSKSEAMIDMTLYLNKIPFRYECLLELNNISLFPDFTILHPHTGKIFYWEHFGMMDDPNYSKSAYSKLQLYNTHQIYPSINLITTFETKESPLSSDLVEKMIQHYFL